MNAAQAADATPTIDAAQSVDAAPLWKPFKTAELIAMRRCPGCGWSPREQGHSPRCPIHPGQEAS